MLYNVTLRDLGIAQTGVGVRLQLYGCQEVTGTAWMPTPEAFIGFMLLGKTVGYQIIADGRIPTIPAVEVPDPTTLFADFIASDAVAIELRPDDPMYRVANEYDSHQLMRETIREALDRGTPRPRGEEWRQMEQGVCALTLWLAMHDPEFGNSMRERMLECLQIFKQAILSVACTKRRAYLRDIGPVPRKFSTKELRQADQSNRSSLLGWD